MSMAIPLETVSVDSYGRWKGGLCDLETPSSQSRIVA